MTLTKEFPADDEHILVVVSVMDQGGFQGHCNISIKIVDVNSPPIFLENPFSVRILENSPIGFHVLKIKARDQDREENAILKFSMESNEFK